MFRTRHALFPLLLAALAVHSGDMKPAYTIPFLDLNTQAERQVVVDREARPSARDQRCSRPECARKTLRVRSWISPALR